MLNYKSKEAAEYFSKNRYQIDGFYDSEKYILNAFIEKVNSSDKYHSILDIGCASGGLGRALKDRLKGKLRYIGIDINPLSIDFGRNLYSDLELIEGDFSKKINILNKEKIDTVFSFSCIDWNEDFEKSLETILNFCKNKQSDFIFTFRASEIGINNMQKSYQFINYENEKRGEIANYVVLSFEQIKLIIEKFNSQNTLISAYKGLPSEVAVTPYSELVFGCIWFQNCFKGKSLSETLIEGKFPLSLIL